MSEYLKNGHARKVTHGSLAPALKTWHVPHHTTRGKLGIVFDCAAKFKGTSLNDHLRQGPDHTCNLIVVLLRFRSRSIPVMAGIKRMFHQVRVATADCDTLRFLWWPNGDHDTPPEEYQIIGHFFGVTFSPSVCDYALLSVAIDNLSTTSPGAIRALQKSFYVDDLLISFESDDEAEGVVLEVRQLLEDCGFHLSKFVSIKEESLVTVPEKDRRESKVEVNIDNPRVEKALGVALVLHVTLFN